MNSKAGVILGIIALILAVAALSVALVHVSYEFSQEHEFTLYIGLNDKDTGELTLPIADAVSTIDKICSSHLSGYTLIPAVGRWNSDDKTLVKENTVICYITDSSEDAVREIVNELIPALNQETILVADNRASIKYYYQKTEHTGTHL